MSVYTFILKILINSIFLVSILVFGLLIAGCIMFIRLKLKEMKMLPFMALQMKELERYRLRCSLFGFEEDRKLILVLFKIPVNC